VLVELGVVEQRYQAVREVLDGSSVTAVARRYGVARQTVHVWLRRYADGNGLNGLADRFSRPASSASDAGEGRGSDRGDAGGASGVGSLDDLVTSSAGGDPPRCVRECGPEAMRDIAE